MILRLASYNVHKCIGIDRRRRPDRTVAVIAALKADIVALQEVDHRLGSRPTTLSRDMLERTTGLTTLPFALSRHGLGWHGQVLMTTPAIKLVDLTRLVLPGLEPRGAVLADLDTPDGPVRIVGVHLGLLRRYRKMQLAAIRAALLTRTIMPTVIMGDFNEWSTRGGTETLGAQFRTHAPGLSFPAGRPVARLDRVALGQGAHLMDAGTYDTALARTASDHLPIWADIRFSTVG